VLVIQDVLVSEAVLEERFRCELSACKGACCWEGDFGAPLEPEECRTLEHIFEDIRPFLSPEGADTLAHRGKTAYYAEMDMTGTPLLPDGACAYLTFGTDGVAHCGIEQAWKAGRTDFRKPVSCHLYPLRVSRNEAVGFEALNYDKWDICSAACSAGRRENIPVYRFVRDAIIRKYGPAFYEELDAMAAYLAGKDPDRP
jgi:hypothetical protein